MRKELEQIPVDTVILKDHLRRGLENKMKKYMKKGYVPLGGVSTNMNTHTKPLFGVSIHDFVQTMVLNKTSVIWIKETDEDHEAFNAETVLQNFSKQAEELEESIRRDIKSCEKLKPIVENTRNSISSRKASFLSNIKQSISVTIDNGHKLRLSKTKENITKNQAKLKEVNIAIESCEVLLARYYKKNPSITKNILLESR